MTRSAVANVSVHSRITSPIEKKSRLRQSLLFAELANLAYFDEIVVQPVAASMGLSQCRFFERDGAQAYVMTNDHDCIVVCRGTETHDWNDLKADVNAATVFTETLGKVHKGFSREVDDLWPSLEDILAENTRPLWFCGHSLGGAMATICAGRCFLSEIKAPPKALYTFGSPRVGDKQFVNFVRLEHIRWVNNNDIVTRVPPVWMGYRHCGTEMYLNNVGRLQAVNGWQRSYDRLKGFLKNLLRFKIDHLADHSMERYIESILCEVKLADGSL